MFKIILSNKAQMDNLMQIVLWIAVFVMLVAGVYFLVKFLTGM